MNRGCWFWRHLAQRPGTRARRSSQSPPRAARATPRLRPPAMLPSRRRALAPLALALVLGSPPPLFASTDADACFWNAATGACQASARWLASNRLVFSDQGLFLAELVGGVETCASAFNDADACAAADHCAYYPAAGACLPDASWSLDTIRRCVIGRGSDVDPAVTAIASLASECLARSSSEDACAAPPTANAPGWTPRPTSTPRSAPPTSSASRPRCSARGRSPRSPSRKPRASPRPTPARATPRRSARGATPTRGARRTPSERSACRRGRRRLAFSGSRRRVSPGDASEDACADVGNDALGCVWGRKSASTNIIRRNTAATAATEAADGGATTRTTPPTNETRRRVILRTRCSRRGRRPRWVSAAATGSARVASTALRAVRGVRGGGNGRGAVRRDGGVRDVARERGGERSGGVDVRPRSLRGGGTSPPVARRGPARGGQPRVRDGRGHEGSVRGGIHGRGRGGKSVQRRGRGRGRGTTRTRRIPRSRRARRGTWW